MVTVNQPVNQRKINLSQAMSPNDSYENLAIIIVLSSCGAAILLAIVILICCHLFIRSKDTVTRTRYYTSSGRGYTLERQTTSSDDNNMELFSCCIEESISQPAEGDDSDGDKMVSPRSSSINGKAPSSNDKSPNTINATAQVRFVCENGEILVSEKKSDRNDEEINKPLNASHRRFSGGIIRQQSFEVPDEDTNLDLTAARAPDEEDEDGKSPETIRREYRELWQLRTTLELEEKKNEPESNETTAEITMHEDGESSEQRLMKYDLGWYSGDSGYRSMERRDYSIDSKTESIYRQFIANSGQTIKSSHQSIQEEQEAEAFV